MVICSSNLRCLQLHQFLESTQPLIAVHGSKRVRPTFMCSSCRIAHHRFYIISYTYEWKLSPKYVSISHCENISTENLLWPPKFNGKECRVIHKTEMQMEARVCLCHVLTYGTGFLNPALLSLLGHAAWRTPTHGAALPALLRPPI